MVQPAIERGSLEHGVLARHLVGKRRHAELVFHAAYDVQVRHAGFDHHHVRPLGDVQRHLAQGLIAVAGVHLIDLFVARSQVGGRAHGVAEGAVKGGCVFGAVGHDPRVDEVASFQCLPDRPDAAVHHVAGGHNVHARLRLCECLLHQHLHGGVVEDVVVFFRVGVQQAILAVAGEGVQRHVGHHAQFGELFFEFAHHARD